MKHVNPDNLSRIELLDHCADLQARLDAMTATAEARVMNLKRLYHLTILEARLVEMLSDGLVRTRDQIMENLYWDRIAEDDVPVIKIVDVLVCKARKKIVGSGFSIATVWGYGYQIENADRLVEAMTGGAAA